MTCTEFRESHPVESSEAKAHRGVCPDCRAFAAGWEALREYPAIAPGPGFFRGVRRKLTPAILRFAAPIAAAAAALLVFAVLTVVPPPPSGEATEEERELVENLDLLQNYDLVRTLELVNESRSPLLEDRK